VLRKLLDRHPDIRAGAETKLFVPAAFNLEWLAQSYAIPLAELRSMRASAPSQGAFIDAFAERAREAAGESRWAEKTPQNIRHLDWIVARWPSATIMHVIRDGRDVVCSMRRHPDRRWVNGGWQKELVPRSVEWYARRWLADTAAGMAWRGDPRYVEVRYEDLVAAPREAMRDLAGAAGASPDAGWLQVVGQREEGPGTGGRPDYEGALSGISVGRWRSDLSAAEQDEVERLCAPRLRELGYEA
jgi:hypothetical protein